MLRWIENRPVASNKFLKFINSFVEVWVVDDVKAYTLELFVLHVGHLSSIRWQRLNWYDQFLV